MTTPATVRVTCSHCHSEVRVEARVVQLDLVRDDSSSGLLRCWCPACWYQHSQHISDDARLISVLRAAGVRVNLPVPLSEAEISEFAAGLEHPDRVFQELGA